MPAEVERPQEELPLVNVDDEMQEISNGGNINDKVNSNCNGNVKEENDSSYVFVMENDTVGDDPVVPYPDGNSDCFRFRSSDHNVEKEADGVVKEENRISGKQKMENGTPIDASVEVSQESQTMVEPEAEWAEVPRDADLENVKGENLESTEEAEQIQASEVEGRGFQEKSETVFVIRDNNEMDSDGVKDPATVGNGVQMVLEAEKAQPSHDVDVTSELGAPNVNDGAKPEAQNLALCSLDEDPCKKSASLVNEVYNSVSDEGQESGPQAVDVPASDERNDVIGLSEENVSGTATVDGLSCANQQEPEHTENDTNSRGSSEDCEPEQETKDQSIQSGQEVVDMNEDFAPGQNQESDMEVNLGTDAYQNTAEEAEGSPTSDLPENVTHENTDSLSTNLSSDLASVNGAADDTTTGEFCEAEVSNVNEISVINAVEEVDSGTKSFYNTEFPQLSDDKAKANIENEPNEKDNKPSWASACFASKTRTSVRDLEPEVAISTDTTHTGNEYVTLDAVADSVDSKLAENKGGNIVIGNGSKTSTSGEDDKAGIDVQPELSCTVDTADATEVRVASTCVNSDRPSVKPQLDGETQKDQASASSGEADVLDGSQGPVVAAEIAPSCVDSHGPSVKLQVDGLTQKNQAAASSEEISAQDASEGQAVAAEIERKPYNFLPKVPRYDDEMLAEQLKHAGDQVDQKTQSRDAVRAELQNIRVSCKQYESNFKAALAEERSTRKALHSKRQEIEHLQSVINRVKSAVSVEDIDSRVHNMEHMIQHETLPLSEEKRLIREIKQLKQLREQISSNMGTQDEVRQALDDKEKNEELLKAFRKELDVLRNDLSKAEAVTKVARKRYDEEWGKQSQLQEQFRAADEVRQEAYMHLQSLRKQLREKNKYFFKYRDDSKAATEMALKKDREALQGFCHEQVETFMNLWNNDDAFRKNYIRCNTRSTLKRLRTLDGRSLGPDEEPTQIPSVASERVDKLRTSSVRPEKHEMVPSVSAQQEKVITSEDAKSENTKAVSKPTKQKNQITKSKKPAKSSPPLIGLTPVPNRVEIEESTREEEEEPKLNKEEEELLRKAEEKRKQEEAAKLKEQHRLEEIAKAKEAMERKKKREEKAKARAALRAKKEAEEKEKEREKKLRKKERKSITASREDTTNQSTELPTTEAQCETPKETESLEKQITETKQPKKSQKQSQFFKQTKTKSIPPPPLRNRGSKRRLKQYMWLALAVILVLALFLLGNQNLSFSSANLWFLI